MKDDCEDELYLMHADHNLRDVYIFPKYHGEHGLAPHMCIACRHMHKCIHSESETQTHAWTDAHNYNNYI